MREERVNLVVLHVTMNKIDGWAGAVLAHVFEETGEELHTNVSIDFRVPTVVCLDDETHVLSVLESFAKPLDSVKNVFAIVFRVVTRNLTKEKEVERGVKLQSDVCGRRKVTVAVRVRLRDDNDRTLKLA
jgi:hypothetical protein